MPVMPLVMVLAAVGVLRILGRPVAAEVPTAILDQGDDAPSEGADA